MNLATVHLKNDQISIREVAESVEYESQASFTNAFKRSFSVSPREFRNFAQALAEVLLLYVVGG